MDQNEMAALFSKILEALETSNKNTAVLNNTLANHCDLIAENNTLMRNLEKVNVNLGSVMTQGIAGKLNSEAWEKLGMFFLKALGK